MVIDAVFGLSGRIALVVGGGKVPQAVADLYAAAGATVVQAREPVIDDEPAAKALLNLAPDLDILVNGLVRIGAYPLDQISLEEFDAMQATNLRAAFLMMREAVRVMRAHGRGGRLISLSTMGSVHPVLNGNAAYASSRAGLNALVRSFALDCVGDNILVNAILVGAVPSEPWPAPAGRPTGPGSDPTRLPLGMGRPEDVAPMALLLASSGGRYITGQAITIDGGFLVA